jgi:hypothetical protein
VLVVKEEAGHAIRLPQIAAPIIRGRSLNRPGTTGARREAGALLGGAV